MLRTIDSATGSTLQEVAITLSGETVTGGRGLARDPTSGVLYALLKLSGEPFPALPLTRLLLLADRRAVVAIGDGAGGRTGIFWNPDLQGGTEPLPEVVVGAELGRPAWGGTIEEQAVGRARDVGERPDQRVAPVVPGPRQRAVE